MKIVFKNLIMKNNNEKDDLELIKGNIDNNEQQSEYKNFREQRPSYY